MNIEFVKLTSGEEFVAERKGETFHNPVVAVAQGQGMAFMPWCHMVEQTQFVFQERDILLRTDKFSAEIKLAYAQNFGSKADVEKVEAEIATAKNEEPRIILPKDAGKIIT